jgi:predicted nucleic acid-binding protein
MYLLDTNVLSEIMRPSPSPTVIDWLDAQPIARLLTSAITRAEIALGIARLPSGHKKSQLKAHANAMFIEDFAHRCLSFDGASAVIYATLVAQRMSIGKPISVEDAQIAAIALHNQLVLVTRNTKDFVDIQGLTLINPWDE